MTRAYLPFVAVVLGPLLVSPALSGDEKLADEKLAGSWVLVEMNGKEIEGTPPTLDFTDNRITGFTGVNRFFGGYAKEGDQLFGKNIGMTLRAGPPERMELERKYVSALQVVTKYQLGDKRLTLDDGDKIKLVFQPKNDKKN